MSPLRRDQLGALKAQLIRARAQGEYAEAREIAGKMRTLAKLAGRENKKAA